MDNHPRPSKPMDQDARHSRVEMLTCRPFDKINHLDIILPDFLHSHIRHFYTNPVLCPLIQWASWSFAVPILILMRLVLEFCGNSRSGLACYIPELISPSEAGLHLLQHNVGVTTFQLPSAPPARGVVTATSYRVGNFQRLMHFTFKS